MFDSIERGLYWLSSFFLDSNVDALCQLDGPLNDNTLLTLSDDLVSLIEIRGARRLIGAVEFEQMAANLANAMSKVMKSANGKQHSFGISSRSDPGSAVRLLKEILGPNLRTARRFGAVDDVHIADQLAALSQKCKEESIYLLLYTHGSGLSPSDKKRLEQVRESASAKYAAAAPGMRLGSEVSQRPRAPAAALVPRHAAALENFVQDLQLDVEKGGVGILAEVLDSGAGLTMMRRHLDASPFDSSWRPRLIGDKSAVLPGTTRRAKDASHAFPMRIGRQLVSEPLTEVFGDVEYARRGSTYYAGVVLEVPPEEGSQPFAELAVRIGRQIPWTMNVELVPNGVDLRKLDQFYAAVVGAMGDHNKRVKSGWRALKEMKNAGSYVGAMRVVFVTWGSSENEVTLNLSFLKSSIESWGSCVSTNETGSPGLVTLCAAAGFSKRMPAPYLPGPLSELARMMPLFSPASVWSSGQLVAHTSEGRPYPVGMGTTMQAYWGILIFAPSGSGKSFLLNMINEGILFAPGQEDLPYFTVIDVGPSSRLVLDLARALLPERLARQIVSIRVRNSPEFAVNPFDTQLGCDRPTEVDRDFQVAIVSTLCPTLGLEGERFIGQVINEAFRMMGRKSPEQRRWQNSLNDRVAESLREIGFVVTEKTFVWDVVDALFDAGRIDDAALAQRYAVPKMSDLIKASRTKEILDSYGNAPSMTDEKMLDVFSRSIQTALSEYELISNVTQFELGNAKAITIDLEEVVTSSESEEGKRRAAMMFLFGRRLGARNYFLRWDEIGDIVPKRYQAYQQARVKQLEESLKFLIYDEVHYASGMPSMFKQIQVDLRVGRKYKCVTAMASQLLADFPPAAVSNCFTYFILGAGTEDDLTKIQSTFGLSSSEVYAIKTECTSPGKLFALFKTVRGVMSQVLHTTAGPFTRWAFSTSKDDALLRAEVASMRGDYILALKLLAKAYPSGTARDEMDKYRRTRGDIVTGESVITVFARNLIKDEIVDAQEVTA